MSLRTLLSALLTSMVLLTACSEDEVPAGAADAGRADGACLFGCVPVPDPAASLHVTAPSGALRAGQSIDVVVTARTAGGVPAESYRGTVAFTTGDARATLPAAYGFRDVDLGQHTFQLTFRTAGTYTLRVADTVEPSLAAEVTGIVVEAGPATGLEFTTQPARARVGRPLAPAIVVAARDSEGNAAPVTGSIALALGAGTTAVLGGTKARPVVNGQAAFDDLTVDREATALTLVASASGLPDVTSNAFDVVGAPEILGTCSGLVRGGTSMVVKGLNFEPTVAGNKINFGLIAGTVVSATPTRLVVNPPGQMAESALQVFAADEPSAPVPYKLGPRRVSVTSAGAEAHGGGAAMSRLSADGRFVAFMSDANDLAANDTNDDPDIFVHDRATGTTRRVSVTKAGAQPAGASRSPAISGDGRVVAFMSISNDIDPIDTDTLPDIYVHELETGRVELVSVSATGGLAGNLSAAPSLSADGRLVAFASAASNLVAGDTNGFRDVFVRDWKAGVTERVSIGANGVEPNDDCDFPSISADGRFVAFTCLATNLAANDANGEPDIFVFDRTQRTLQLVSAAHGGAGRTANKGSYGPAISGGGRFVAFGSPATDLLANHAGSEEDVFVRDLMTGTTELVSVGQPSGRGAGAPVLSADGRYIGFTSYTSDFSTVEIMVRDRTLGVTNQVDVNSAGFKANNTQSMHFWLSLDGQYVSFISGATNLVADDTNAQDDVFVTSVARDACPAPTVLALSAKPTAGHQVVLSGFGFSDDKTRVEVMFGSLLGTVVSATETNLTVTVPAGVLGGILTVTVDGVEGEPFPYTAGP